MECRGICDADERVECYKSLIQQYQNMVLALFTLKYAFKKEGYKAFIEPDIDGRPDLLVVGNSDGVAIDHKVIKSTRKYILQEFKDLLKYRKQIAWNNREIEIKDSALLCPSHVWDSILKEIESEYNIIIPVITYDIIEGEEIIFLHRTEKIHKFLSSPMSKMFRKRKRRIEIPKDAYKYKFILENPPNCYLALFVYERILECRSDFISKEVIVSYDTVKDYIKAHYPGFLSTKGAKVDQINESRLQNAIRLLRQIGVIEEMRGRKIKAKNQVDHIRISMYLKN